MAPTNSLPARGTFKLYYGDLLSMEKDGVDSTADARAWAHEKLVQMKSAEDISFSMRISRLISYEKAHQCEQPPPTIR
ncbi:MAG: hypothetical protein OXC62_00315 [Aestuariivita sp.]|nr:hypothetical protein [Aestuariivita sp.]